MLNNNKMEYVISYQYLGLLLTEFLDFHLMAKAVAKSANRALGLLIVKCKAHGGFNIMSFLNYSTHQFGQS